MPVSAPPADAPYAYVIDYRPLDACAPPACQLAGEKVVGWWDEVQGDGGRGAYVRFGEPRSELYFRRSKVLRADKTYEFVLPPASGDYEFDGYFASPELGAWKAKLEVVREDGSVLWHQDFEGHNKLKIDATNVAEMANYADYFSHVRLALPARDQKLSVRIENEGQGALAVGSPLILKKVLGRRARQAIVLITDSIPEPEMMRMLTVGGDEQTTWLSRTVREQGTLFARGTSPGFNSPTFVRRFFRSGFYETDGELGLFGQGIDEQAPATPPSPVSRIAEQGFQTELTVANFMLLPTLTRLGFDGGYHNEQQQGRMQHPRALVRRFATWVSEHPHDDVLNVIWFSATHAPYPPGRPAPPFDLGAPGIEYSQRHLDEIWRNYLETVDRFQEVMEDAKRAAPGADRVWLVATDHGRTFTKRSMKQPVWLPPHKVIEGGSSHCCVATFEETHTPFAILYDGGPRLTPTRVEEPTSTVAFWRLLERQFGVELQLPNTSTFDSAVLGTKSFASRWDEGLLASAGDSGSVRAVSERWAFRSLLIRPQVGPLFGRGKGVQRALTGSPNRGDYFLAEELYDRSTDPFEQRNVADQEEQTVLAFRRKLADWLAVYYDPPNHPRYEYTLKFPQAVELTITAPQRIRVSVDDAATPTEAAYRVVVKGSRFVIPSEAEPASVIDIEGLALAGLVRCASTGLPLESLSGQRVRLNLAVARNNCVASDRDATLGPNDVGFRAKLVHEAMAGSGGGMTRELVDGLRSWGYVRDLDQANRKRP